MIFSGDISTSFATKYMATVEQVKKALVAVEELCGKCPVCTPDCPVAIAKRALSGLKYDIEAYEQYQSELDNEMNNELK